MLEGIHSFPFPLRSINVLHVRYPEVESWKKKKRSTTFRSNRLKYDSGRLSSPSPPLFHDVSPFRHWPTLVLGRVDRTKIKSRGNKSTMERTLAKITGARFDSSEYTKVNGEST